MKTIDISLIVFGLMIIILLMTAVGGIYGFALGLFMDIVILISFVICELRGWRL